MNEKITIEIQKEDFENIYEYSRLSEKQKDYVWAYAQRKLSDAIMVNHEEVMEEFVYLAMEDKELQDRIP
ncbi:hypothetical protein N9998_00305 [Nitrosopumilus sp.]|nr:hypothetical protein [Nitrosopumilus sp.]